MAKNIMQKILIVQKKSLIGSVEKTHRRTMCALGFGKKGKIGKTLEKQATAQILGMLQIVQHLVITKNI